MIDALQLRTHVVSPTLVDLGLWSEAAVQLIMGTIAQESTMGTYLKQRGNGPACGITQMEPATYYDHWKWLQGRKELADKVLLAGGLYPISVPPATFMIWNLRYAVAMCRIHYYRDPFPLPMTGDIVGMAQTWKRCYNTMAGKGTVEQFVENYNKYLKGLYDA